MIDPNEFNKLFNDLVKVEKPVDNVYKVYYNKKTGKVLQFTTDTLEGDYIKNRCKLVRNDFICGNDHWTKGGIQKNKLKFT